MRDTIAALATPPGKSGVGVIRIAGPRALELSGAVFTPEKAEMPDRMMVRGTIHNAEGGPIDHALGVFFKGPGSFTGDDVVELHCHGSLPVLNSTLRLLYDVGVRPAEAGEFTKRAFLAGKMDLIQAEAIGELIASETEEAAMNAVLQMDGVLSRELSGVYDLILNVLAHFQAMVDYPDEDVAAFEIPDTAAALHSAAQRLESLANDYERAKVLKEGVTCAIIGRPNVGKSSLLNTICGYDRAIVTPVAGTTRDVVEVTANLGGLVLRLQDTAGIRKARDQVEHIGITKALAAAKGAALLILVINASEPLQDEDMQVIDATMGHSQAIVVLNNISGERVLTPEDFSNDFSYICEVDAKGGEGVDAIVKTVHRLYNTEGLRHDGTLITNARQQAACKNTASVLGETAEALSSGVSPDMVLLDVEEAMRSLADLLGKDVSADLLDKVFSNFCIGK
ncbi:tRNA uridine-5-carboxymethylaminomethyl(34) synthesis GTPase MnmE [Oscillospiraceae bacterium OttesenSCG-928-F05]|nr:tRNA uridine-5-carboxymethylaminomethyl(34) synthesis GTPase MnmE [Oscillospiraceae bacterium OttesenSCG-928-F05]